MNGRFFVFEGIDGGGKTGLIKEVAESLESIGFRVFVVREPGGSKVSEHIRELLLNGFPGVDGKPDHMTEALLFNAARCELMNTVVIPKLKEGCIVLSDRFVDSTLVYQGYCRGSVEGQFGRIDKLMRLHDLTIGMLPRATIFIECDPEVAYNRSVGRGGLNLLDGKDKSEAKQRYDAYHAIMKIKEHKHPYFVFDNTTEGEEALQSVVDKITRKIESTIVFDQRDGLLTKVLENLKALEFKCWLKSEQSSLVDRLTLQEDQVENVRNALVAQDGCLNLQTVYELEALGFKIHPAGEQTNNQLVAGESWIQLSCGRVYF